MRIYIKTDVVTSVYNCNNDSKSTSTAFRTQAIINRLIKIIATNLLLHRSCTTSLITNSTTTISTPSYYNQLRYFNYY